MNDVKYNQISVFDRRLLRDLPLCIVIVLGLSFIMNGSYFIFHILVESLSIIISFIFLSISLSTCRFNTNRSIIFLGMAYGFIGAFDLIHMLTYNGMGAFADSTGNISAQLWIAARYMESISFLASFVLGKKRIDVNIKKAFIAYLIISILVLASIFYLDIFPQCMARENKATYFKIISEFIITGILIGGTTYYVKGSSININRYPLLLMLFLTTSAISEMFLSLTGTQLMHSYCLVFKLIYQYFLYIEIIKTSLEEPYIALHSLNQTLMEKNEKLKELVRVQREESEYRRKIEHENMRKKQILDGILESTMSGILVLDNNKDLLHVNSQFMRMLNIPQEIASSGNIQEIVKRVKDNLTNPEKFDLYIMESEKVSGPYTFYFKLKDERIFEVSNLPYIDRGEKAGIVIHVRDITDKEKMEELKRKIEIKKELLKKAKEIDDMKTSFFNTISHEIRTPLNVILSMIQVLEYEGKSNKDGYYLLHEDSVKALLKNSYRLIKLADNLIDITRIDSGHMNLNLRNHDIVKIIKGKIHSAVEYVKSSDILIRFESNTSEKIMACDAQKIERVLLNLLSNAIKFTEPKADILVSLEDKNESIVIRVKDNGIGIPSNMVDKIFDRLKQVDTSLRRLNEGLGIGLSIVKSIVEMHGGNIKVNSKEGEGSEFIIELPVHMVEEDDRACADMYMGIDRVNIEFSDIYGIN